MVYDSTSSKWQNDPTITAQLTVNTGDIADIQTEQTTQNNRLTTNEADISTIQSEQITQDGRLTTNEANITSNTNRLDNLVISDNNDVTTTTPADDELLVYDTTQWVNRRKTATDQEYFDGTADVYPTPE